MCGTFELGVQKLLKVPNAKTFAFNYNFRCRKFVVKHEKTYVWHMVELPSSKFKSSTKGQVQFFLHLATNYWCQKLVAKHKKLTFGMFQNFQAWSSKVPIGAKSKCFCIQPFCKLAEAKHIFLVISLLWIFWKTCLTTPWEVEVIFFIRALMELLGFELGASIRGQAKKNVFFTSNFQCQKLEVKQSNIPWALMKIRAQKLRASK